MIMQDKILHLYNEELQKIRNEAQQFASRHPQVADNLKINNEQINDPLIAGLIESYAYLTASLRQQIDDEYQLISQTLLNQLYPHYLQPIPSASIIQLTTSEKLKTADTLPRHTALTAHTTDGSNCQFQTVYDTPLAPIEIAEISYINSTAAPQIAGLGQQLKACLKISISSKSAEFSLAKDLDRVRFYIKMGIDEAQLLYQQIFNQTIKLTATSTDNQTTMLPNSCIKTIGFAENEGLLPYAAQSHPGYRLLTEYFCFPQKFLFFELTDLRKYLKDQADDKINLYFYLNRFENNLSSNVNHNSLALHCTPIVNLFKTFSDPVKLTPGKDIYHVTTNKDDITKSEIINIINLNIGGQDNSQKLSCRYFFDLYDHDNTEKIDYYWHMQRKPSWQFGHPDLPGNEVLIQISDRQGKLQTFDKMSANIECWCCNRDLPLKIDPQSLAFKTTAEMASGITLLSQPTPTLRIDLSDNLHWRLLSHLNLNHLSLSNDDFSLENLRSLLKLYNFNDNPQNDKLLNSLSKLQVKPTMARHPSDPRAGFCQGLDIQLTFDEHQYQQHRCYFFATVLDKFLSQYCHLNTFTQLSIASQQQGVIAKWTPRIGQQMLL
jgi:type VI secretion system protein ImpG